MENEQRWIEVRNLLERLYLISERLEQLFPGRKFTPDGHLVGSIGEVLAEYIYDVTLSPASSKAHDGQTSDGRCVQVKLTQAKMVALSQECDHLLVFQRTRSTP